MASRSFVAVWKRVILPRSETFIRRQVDAVGRYPTRLVGLKRHGSGLERDEDLVLKMDKFEAFQLKALSLFSYSRAFKRFLREERPLLVHAHFGIEAIVISRMCRKARVPLIVTLHGHDVNVAPRVSGFRGWRYRLRLRAMFRNAAMIIAVSSFIADRAVSLGAPAGRVRTVYIGVPVGTQPQSIPYEKRSWDVVFVGRLVEVKGAEDVLRAVALAQEERSTPIRVAIVGDGALRSRLEEIARTMSAEVQFWGFVSSDRVAEILADSRIFVGASRTSSDGAVEAFGLVYAEAGASGLPVVAYAHGGVREAVLSGVTGLLSDEGDVADLGRNLARLLDHPDEAVKLGEQGRLRVAAEFDLTQQTHELELIYDEVLGRRGFRR